jgi:uncharacterized protein with von Willebrand factor type A (vWA) domain
MASHANTAGVLPAPADSLAEAVMAAIAEFARKLRWLGLEVSTAEAADATRAVAGADLLDRNQVRGRLQATLVKRAADIPTFEAAFDLLFPALTPSPAERAEAAASQESASGAPQAGEQAAPDLLARLVSMLRGETGAGMSQLAAEVVSAYGGLQEGQVAGSQRYYEYRIMRQLDLSTLLQRAMRQDGDALPPGLGRRLAGLEQHKRMEELRAEIAANCGPASPNCADPSPLLTSSASPSLTRSSCGPAQRNSPPCARSSGRLPVGSRRQPAAAVG